MSHHRYKSEFLSWKSPYSNPRYPSSVTDQQIANNASKAFKIDRRGRIHSPSKSGRNKQYNSTEDNRQHDSNMSLRDSRLKREIIREMHSQLPGSLTICIPIRTMSAPPQKKKQSKSDNEQNEELNKLKNDFEEMKEKMKQQDELIEHLRQQLSKKDTKPPPKAIEIVIPTMPYVEDPPSIELVQTVWE